MDEDKQLKLLESVIEQVTASSPVSYENLPSIHKKVIETLEECLDEPNYELIEYNLKKYFKCVFVKNPEYEGTIIYDRDDMIVPKEYKDVIKQIRKIANVPQPEQGTIEWLEKRKEMLTASTAAAVLGESHYDKPDSIIMDKLGHGTFTGNKFTHHGSKYEDIAKKIYEVIYKVNVDEYGLIPHLGDPPVKFLGASPDGITNQFKLDNSFNKELGRMIEIKVPPSRVIKTKGKPHGDICPHHYWCQIQQQLECCGLELCDFWQCRISEYETREEYLEDNIESICTEEQEKPLNLPKNCMKGMILQFIPRKKAAFYSAVYSAKWIYPETVDMTLFEYDQWILNELADIRIKHKELMQNYVFDRVIYWKLENCHNVLIERDREWFKNSHPKFKEVWDKITFLRNDQKEYKKFVDKMNERKRKKVESDEELLLDSDSD